MERDVNLLSFCWKIATFFDAYNESKAFHIWVIMFTYLSLVGAWVYYRKHANDDDEKDEEEVEIDDAKDRIPGDDLDEDNELAYIISLDTEGVLEDECFEQVASIERATQTDRITDVVYSEAVQTKACREKESREPATAKEISEENNIINNESDNRSDSGYEKYHIEGYAVQGFENRVYGKSQENGDSQEGEIKQSTNPVIDDEKLLSECYFENNPRVSQSTDVDYERWRLDEEEIEMGFMLDLSNKSNLDNFEGQTLGGSRGLRNIAEEEISIEETFELSKTIAVDESPPDIDLKESDSSPIFQESEGFLDETSLVSQKNPGDSVLNCCEDEKDGNLGVYDRDEGSISDIDLEMSGGQICNFSRFDSMIDSVEKHNFAYPLDGGTGRETSSDSADDVAGAGNNKIDDSDKEEIVEKITASEVAPVQSEIEVSNCQGLDELWSTHLKKSEQVSCGLDESRNHTFDSEDNITENAKRGALSEQKDFVSGNESDMFLQKESIVDGYGDKQTVGLYNDENAPAAVEGKDLFEIDKNVGKQFARITNAAEIKKWIGLTDEVESDNESEAWEMSDEQCDISDGYSERYKGITDDFNDLIEGGSIVTDLQSELPDCYSEICEERSEINDSLNIDGKTIKNCIVYDESPVQKPDTSLEFTDDFSEITDGFSEVSTGCYDICGEFKELADNASAITDIYSEIPDGYSETFDERSDISEDHYEVSENGATEMIDKECLHITISSKIGENAIERNNYIKETCQEESDQDYFINSLSDNSDEVKSSQEILNKSLGESIVEKTDEPAENCTLKTCSTGEYPAEDSVVEEFRTKEHQGKGCEKGESKETEDNDAEEQSTVESFQTGAEGELDLEKEYIEIFSENEAFTTCNEYETTDTEPERDYLDFNDAADNNFDLTGVQFNTDTYTDSASETEEEPVSTSQVVFDESEGDYSQTRLSENDGFAARSENWIETDIESDVVPGQYDDIVSYKSVDNESINGTTEELCEHVIGEALFEEELREDFQEDNNPEGEMEEKCSKDGQSYVVFEHKDNSSFLQNEKDIFAEERSSQEDLEIDESNQGISENEDGTSESGSIEEINYELLVSSGAESDEEDKEERCDDFMVETEGCYSRMDGGFDVQATSSVLETIDEEDECNSDGDISSDTYAAGSAVAKEKSNQAVMLRGTQKFDLNMFANPRLSYNIQMNWREIALALSCCPKSMEFVHYFRNLLLNPGVFVDVFNNAASQLHCHMGDVDRIAELYAEKLSRRSDLGLIVYNRDLYFAKKNCKIVHGIDHYFSKFKKDFELEQGSMVLPGYFGISYPKKAHYNEDDRLMPIDCESLSKQEADSVHAGKENRISTKFVHPAINVEDSNEFNSDKFIKTKRTPRWQCNKDVGDYVFLTTLAAVDGESFGESSSSWTSSDEYLENEATAFLEVDELESNYTEAVLLTDDVSKQRQLKRNSSSDFEGDFERKRPRSLLETSDSVSQSDFDIPFERKFEFSNVYYQEICDNDGKIGDVDEGEAEVKRDKINFDVLFSKTLPFTDLNSDSLSYPQGEFIDQDREEKRQKFDPESETVDNDTTLDMGQAQSVGIAKGTLAMPVSNHYLRGISIRNQGDYAVINYKNTRFAPVISVDKRLEITMQIPKQNEILPAKRADCDSVNNSNSNNFHAEVSSNDITNESINVEVLNEFIKQSVANGDGVKKSAEPYFDGKNNANSLKFIDVGTVPYSGGSETLSLHVDKIAEIAQKFCETAAEQPTGDNDESDEVSSDKIFEKLGVNIYVENAVSEPIIAKSIESVYSECLDRKINGNNIGVISEVDATAKERCDTTVDICAITFPEKHENTIFIDRNHIETSVNNPSFGAAVAMDQESNAVEDTGNKDEDPLAANCSYFEDSNVTEAENKATNVVEVNADFQAAVNDSCFEDFGVTYPDVDNELIQSVNNNDFEVAVNENGELSAVESRHEDLLLEDDKIFDGKQKDLPQQVDFEILQREIRVESVATEIEVSQDNKEVIEYGSTEHLVEIPKYNKVRSKSLSSLPEGLFENMSWFYRDRPSSACFNNKNLIASEHGALRRTKSAELSRRKPKIKMSTYFERRPIKETNLDELMRSLEYLGPRKKGNPPANQSLTEDVAKIVAKGSTNLKTPRVKEAEKIDEIVADIRKAKSTTMLVSRGRYGEKKESESVAKLVEKFESPSTRTRKIIIETKRIYKQEPRLRNAKSMDIAKNLKHLNKDNKTMGSLDENNNKRIKPDQRGMAFLNKAVENPASVGVYEIEKQSCTTNTAKSLTKGSRLEQQQSTKQELNADLNTRLNDKARELYTAECVSEDRPPEVCNDREKTGKVSIEIQKFTSTPTEDKTSFSRDSKEIVVANSDGTNLDRYTSDSLIPAHDEGPKRRSIYGFTVFLSESHISDTSDLESKCENEANALPSPSQEHFWMQQRNGYDGEGKGNGKVSDIDLVLKTTFQASFESIDGLADDTTKTACSNCGKFIQHAGNSPNNSCSECAEKDRLQRQKSHEKSDLKRPRSRNSFRKDRRLRKWLEERQSSMNSEDKALLDDMDVEDQSRLLRKIALSKGIDYKERGEDEKKKKRYSSFNSRQFDFLEQLRYLINFEDDDYDDCIKNLDVNEKEHDAIELLREYEVNRQLKRGKSPFTSDDEGNDSDAFTDITDTSFSDYARSRQSLNSLCLSQGSLYKWKSFEIEENDHDSNEKETLWKSPDVVENRMSNSPPYFEPVTVDKSTSSERGNVEEADIKEAAVSNVAHLPETSESVEKMVAAELFSMEDVNGLISQATSAVRNRRGRAARNSAPRPTSNLGVGDEEKPRSQSLGRLLDVNSDDVFIANAESNNILTNVVEIERDVPLLDNARMRRPTNMHIYTDSPCSLLTERLNDASYESLRVDLINKPAASPKLFLPLSQHQTFENKYSSPISLPAMGSLPSPTIRKLKSSPQQRRRAASLREIPTENKTPSPRGRNLHSVPTSPPRYIRESPFRKSTGSYDRRRKECRSLPDLIAKPDDSTDVSPVKLSRYPSGGSSTLSLQKRSPHLPRVSSQQSSRSSLRSPIRSPVRSPRFSEFDDETADTETVFSDQTAFLSDSSLDIGMAVDGYEVGDEDFFLPNSMRGGNLSQSFDDFMGHDSDGVSSGEYFVPLNTRSKRPESRLISCAFGPCKNKDFVDWSQRSQFTSCVSCFTYYCSKECRKAHWKEHKLTCYYGRINYYTKALLRRFETNSDINENLSRLALEGFQDSGRGCVLITFSSPMAAKFFLVAGTNVFVKDPAYATLNEVMSGGIVTKHQVLLQQTLQDYNPEFEFVVNLTVFVGKQNQVVASNRSRFNSSALLRCTKIPLSSIFLSSDCGPYPETSYDIKVFYLPRSKNHHFVNETEARRYYCRDVSYGLRKYGVFLKRDHPEAYDKLCLYVEHNIEFVPITLYGQSNGSNYKCIIFPEGFSESAGTMELQGRGMLV